MGKTRRIDNREFEDYQSPRKNKYSRNKKKGLNVTDNTIDPYFDPDFESDAERRWAEEYEELNPENENRKGN